MDPSTIGRDTVIADTTAIRHLAGLLREQADELRALATSLVCQARGAPWRGRAADAMRAGVERCADDLRTTADLHEEAAVVLLVHATAVDETVALIAAIESTVHDLVDGARHRIAGIAGMIGAVVDPVDDLLDRFTLPPTGSLHWLDAQLPGLGSLVGMAA